MKKGKLTLYNVYKKETIYNEIGTWEDETLSEVFHNIGTDHIYISGNTALNLRFFEAVKFLEDNEQNKKEV